MTTSRCDRVIHVAAGVVIDREGRTLLVRKAGTAAFMQPGGKPCAGESAEQALRREIAEELGCGLLGTPVRLGRFVAPAANEPNRTVQADLFAIELDGEARPGGEIAEVRWHDPHSIGGIALAPLTRDHVLPIVRSTRP